MEAHHASVMFPLQRVLVSIGDKKMRYTELTWAPTARMAITDKQTRSRINLNGDVTQIVSLFA